MSQTDEQEFEELSIGTVAGLQAFLRNAQTQFNVGLEKEAELMTQGDYEYGSTLHDVYQKVRGTTNHLIEKLKSGESVSTNDAEELQLHYDRLVRVIYTSSVKKLNQSDPEGKVVHTKEKVSEKETDTQAEKQKIKSEPETNQPKDNQKAQAEKYISKPKTGKLLINSDDEKQSAKAHSSELEEVKDSKERVVGETKKKKKRKRQSKKRSANKHDDYKNRIVSVTKLSRERLENLHHTFSNPNTVQSLLFDEAREGLEQLEIISKKSDLSEKQISMASEVVSHIKKAMDSIGEAEEFNVDDENDITYGEMKSVPIITDRVQSRSGKDIGANKVVSFVPTSVTTSKPTVAKRTVPHDLQTLPKPADIYEAESLTEKYLSAPKYQRFINERYSSPAGFERLLDATITKIEADTIDQIEKWLGDLPASAFAFIKDMTISEFAFFAKRPYEEVVADLQKENIKFETFVAWRDLTDEMLELIANGETMTFGQLFAHWTIEIAMQNVE